MRRILSPAKECLAKDIWNWIVCTNALAYGLLAKIGVHCSTAAPSPSKLSAHNDRFRRVTAIKRGSTMQPISNEELTPCVRATGSAAEPSRRFVRPRYYDVPAQLIFHGDEFGIQPFDPSAG